MYVCVYEKELEKEKEREERKTKRNNYACILLLILNKYVHIELVTQSDLVKNSFLYYCY